MAILLLPVIKAITMLFSIMFIGTLYNRLFKSSSWYIASTKALFNIVYWILVPLTFVEKFSATGVSSILLFPLVSLSIYLLIAYAIIWKINFKDKETKYIVFLNSINQNNLFIGYPVLYAIFKDATMSLLFGLISIILVIIVPDFLGSGSLFSKRLLINPVVIGLAIGLFIHYFSSNGNEVTSALSWVPSALSYLSIFMMGVQLTLNFKSVLFDKKAFLIMNVIKFAVNPLVYIPIMYAFNLPVLYRQEALVLGIMPPATLNVVMAYKYNWHPDYVASSIFIMTIMSLLFVILVSFVFNIL